MQGFQHRRFLAMSAAVVATFIFAAGTHAETDIDAKVKAVTKSLVPVEFTIRNENVSREEAGQGILIHDDGIILISGALIPENYPKEWIKDLKVRVASKNFTSVPAKLIGRTKNRLFAFLKTEKPIDAPVFTPGEMTKTSLGQQVFSIARLGKAGGYEPYVGTSRVKELLDLTHPMANTDSFGLTRGTSPVFDLESGKLVGITFPAMGDSMILRDSSGMHGIQLIDDEQSSAYLPAEEVVPLFKNIPTAPFESPRAWLAIDGITGISEDIRSLKEIKQPSGVMIGSVIANEAADKAGLLPQDIILTIDGKPFSTSPVPEIMVMHLSHAVERYNAGDKITVGILRDGKNMEVPATLSAAPKTAGEMPAIFSAKVGVVTRDLVFYDAYARRLPQETKGVMVELVKNGSPASLGSTPLHMGDLITKVNDQSITDQKQFLGAMKKIDDAPDMKEAVFVVIQPDGNTQVRHIDLTK